MACMIQYMFTLVMMMRQCEVISCMSVCIVSGQDDGDEDDYDYDNDNDDDNNDDDDDE